MSLLPIILALAIIGFLCWILLQIPMPQVFRNVIIGVMILFLVLWVLQALGVVTGLSRLTLK